jgi:outer membrane protein assembly factor BamE
LICFVTVTGCVYRVSIPQGNFIEAEDLDQAEVGMTKTQIRFLLGTPMIDDPFSRERWDYAYYLVLGRKEAVQKRWVTIYFNEDIVSKIRRDQELNPNL